MCFAKCRRKKKKRREIKNVDFKQIFTLIYVVYSKVSLSAVFNFGGGAEGKKVKEEIEAARQEI
jgi:hypothetical protein